MSFTASNVSLCSFKIIDGLLQSLVIQEKTAGIYAEPRRNSVKALTRLYFTIFISLFILYLYVIDLEGINFQIYSDMSSKNS